MRTAKQVLAKYLPCAHSGIEGDIIKAMQEYAKQAIEEAANIARVSMPSHPHLHGSKNVNTNEILNLRDKLS